MYFVPGAHAFLGFGMPGIPEMIIIGIIMLLLFGRRLPEVARNMGRGVIEFKKGLSGLEDEVKSTDIKGDESESKSNSNSNQQVITPREE